MTVTTVSHDALAPGSFASPFAGPRFLDTLPVGVLVTDDQPKVLAVNQEWHTLTGLNAADSLGDGWLAVIDPVDRPRLRSNLERVLLGRRAAMSGDYGLVGGDTQRWLRWRFRSREDGARGLVMAVIDVTADQERQAKLLHRATHDGLTGLVSRSEFLASVERALRRRARHPGKVVVVFIDLDDFKRVNDGGGHLLGDRVLATTGRRLREAVRPEDIVARVGGDEFAVLCDDVVDATDTTLLGERIRAALDIPFEVDGHEWQLGATIGIAVADTTERSAEAVIDAADRAMYEAKRNHHHTSDGSTGPDGPGPSSNGSRQPKKSDGAPRRET